MSSSFEENVVWSPENISLSDMENHVLDFPILVKTNAGYYGKSHAETVEKDHVMLLHGWETYERMVARNEMDVAISIPVQQNYKLKITFKTTKDQEIQTEPLTPRSILKLYSPPMHAHFDEAVEFKFYVGNEIFSSRNFGKMTIEKVYPVKYLLTSDINERGAIDVESLGALPVTTRISLSQAIGIRNLAEDSFKQLMQLYLSDTAQLLTNQTDIRIFPELSSITEYTDGRGKRPEVLPKPKLTFQSKNLRKEKNKSPPNSYRLLLKRQRVSILPTEAVTSKASPSSSKDDQGDEFFYGLPKITKKPISPQARKVTEEDIDEEEEDYLDMKNITPVPTSVKPPRPPPPLSPKTKRQTTMADVNGEFKKRLEAMAIREPMEATVMPVIAPAPVKPPLPVTLTQLKNNLTKPPAPRPPSSGAKDVVAPIKMAVNPRVRRESGPAISQSPRIPPPFVRSMSEPSIQNWCDVPSDIVNMSLEEVACCLRLLKLEGYIEMFNEYQVDGNLLKSYKEEDFKEWGMNSREAKKLYMFASQGWRLKVSN